MRLPKVLAVMFSAALCAAVWAQESMSAPPPELKKLEAFLGDWTYTSTWTMPGMTGEMSGKIKAEWAGPFMKMVSDMEMSGFKMVETAYFGWDAKKGKYYSYTFADYAPIPRIEWGVGDIKKIVFISEPWEVLGQSMTTRTTLTMKSDKEFTFVIEMKEGDKWTKASEGTQKKKG